MNKWYLVIRFFTNHNFSAEVYLNQVVSSTSTERIFEPCDVFHIGYNYYVYEQDNLYGLYDARAGAIRLPLGYKRLELFPNTTHLWVEKNGKCGIFDIKLGAMLVPVIFGQVFHTPEEDMFIVWDDGKNLGTYSTKWKCLTKSTKFG